MQVEFMKYDDNFWRELGIGKWTEYIFFHFERLSNWQKSAEK